MKTWLASRTAWSVQSRMRKLAVGLIVLDAGRVPLAGRGDCHDFAPLKLADCPLTAILTQTLAVAALFAVLPACAPTVQISTLPDHQGQPSFRIETPSATWIYHQQGAGFASLLDPDGNDWISYRPGNRAAGEFRGIPNLIHPGAGMHPGGELCSSSVTGNRIESTCENGAWAAHWDFFDDFARLTVNKAPRPYWFLYEGTPGGKLDLDHDYWLLSDGTRGRMEDSFAKDLPDPEWIAFGDERLQRVLVIAKEQSDNELDQFYQMDGEMTVFGFGREHRCCGKYLTGTPASFVVFFFDTADPAAITSAVTAF